MGQHNSENMEELYPTKFVVPKNISLEFMLENLRTFAKRHNNYEHPGKDKYTCRLEKYDKDNNIVECRTAVTGLQIIQTHLRDYHSNI